MTMVRQLAVVCPLVFLAGFVDAVAGGGGLISLPAYYLTGMPAHFALGSNKFSSCAGTLFSTGRFLKSGSFDLLTAAVSASLALAGSFCGAGLALVLDDRALRVAMLILLPAAAVFLLLRGGAAMDRNGSYPLPRRRAILLSAVIGFLLGAYDGFFGPGTGTFLILAFTAVLGFDLKTACGNTKVVNLSSNAAAVAAFVASGAIRYDLAVPAAVCSVAGHWIGSGLAIRRGAGFIRPVMILVLALLFVKLVRDMFV